MPDLQGSGGEALQRARAATRLAFYSFSRGGGRDRRPQEAKGCPEGVRFLVLDQLTDVAEKRARQAQQSAEKRKGYMAELELALEPELFGDVRGLLRAISQLPDSDVPLTRVGWGLARRFGAGS